MTQQLTLKKFGNYSISENKVRINYDDGTDSVLFEDIASISVKTITFQNTLLLLLFLAIGFLILIFGVFRASLFLSLLALCLFIVGIILAFAFPKRFDNVIIETRGGKLIVFSVDDGDGYMHMEIIENEKRKFVKS
jgi:hypothetical protein